MFRSPAKAHGSLFHYFISLDNEMVLNHEKYRDVSPHIIYSHKVSRLQNALKYPFFLHSNRASAPTLRLRGRHHLFTKYAHCRKQLHALDVIMAAMLIVKTFDLFMALETLAEAWTATRPAVLKNFQPRRFPCRPRDVPWVFDGTTQSCTQNWQWGRWCKPQGENDKHTRCIGCFRRCCNGLAPALRRKTYMARVTRAKQFP